MPRIQVIADDGRVTLDEWACAEQLAGQHYRRCLADRLKWAVEDAEDDDSVVLAGAALRGSLGVAAVAQ
jgi:hypothetical protein